MTPTEASETWPDFHTRIVLIAAYMAASIAVAQDHVVAARGQDAARVVPAGQIPPGARATRVPLTGQVPRDGYKTWSLFLVCNPAWATSERQQDLAKLYENFKAFGDAIGDHNLSVWFSTRGTLQTNSPELDAARSARYCRTLQLKPSLGPYLVVTASYPDEARMPNERAVFELGGLGPTDISALLGKLADDLLLSDTVPQPPIRNSAVAPTPAIAGSDSTARGTPAGSGAPSLWTRLLQGAQENMVGFGCRVNLHVTTGLLNAELRECPKP
jgi:hypothetical protein